MHTHQTCSKHAANMSYIKHAANMKHIQVVSCWITISNWCCQCMTSFLFLLPIVLHLFASLTTLTYERIPRHHQVALLLLWPSLGSLHSWKLHHEQPTCMSGWYLLVLFCVFQSKDKLVMKPKVDWLYFHNIIIWLQHFKKLRCCVHGIETLQLIRLLFIVLTWYVNK